jgi:predicted metal-dependent HD superfamily phosphohydrolase
MPTNNNMTLQAQFNDLLLHFSADPLAIEKCWREIETAYTHKSRHYHTLEHLENLLGELLEIKPLFGDWQAALFTLFYHDAVYNPLKKNNEEKSAELAEKRMMALNIPPAITAKTKAQILATKSHESSSDADTNFFTDADLSILGCEWATYAQYCQQVRQEYAVFPDLLYKPGRKKVLQHFLAMERIYKTAHFYEKYEAVARENLARELAAL